MNSSSSRVSGSFRDPSGFLFSNNGTLYRQVNISYKKNYELLFSTGLFEKLVKEKLLINHEEVEVSPEEPEYALKIIKPEKIPFISYPYEWSFSQLKGAALTTLQVEKISLEHGMTLKDASAYNIQFIHGSPIFIDSLSFERYETGRPWIAYRQFCKHFLAPLSLMSYSDIRLAQLLRVFIDGIPLDLASLLLPKKTWINFGLLMHIHLHAKTEKKYSSSNASFKTGFISKNSFKGLLDNLSSTVDSFAWKPVGTEWAQYYQSMNYSEDAFVEKRKIIERFIELVKPTSVWDLGANTGIFSRVASGAGIPTISFDVDPACVEMNYRRTVEEKEPNILPLLLDLTNPSPGIGWQNNERSSLLERGPADLVLALALIHHLSISNNIPLTRVAEFLSGICRSLIIEFVPKNDQTIT
jgi:hypothetical protein